MILSHYLNKGASLALTQTEAHIALLRYIRAQVECFALPVAKILSSCERGLLEECGWQGENTPKTLTEFFSECEIYDPQSEKVLGDFANGFGKSYRDESVKECDYYISLLLQRAEEMSLELPRKKKLNTTLCVCGALAVVILFI